MKVSLVIPNWNGAEKLKQNLPQVLKVKGVDEVIVVDDGSTDKSVEVLKSEFPMVHLVERKKNGGFSSAVNTGFRAARGDLVFLLNSDAVPEVDAVEKVLPYFKDEKVFSVGLNAGGTWSWAEFKDGYFWHHQASGTKDETLHASEVHQTLWASGGSAVFRKDIWDKLGGLDEIFNPFYEEDVDLGYRATKSGYENLWDPGAVVEHYKQKGVIEENFSKSFVSKIAQRNQLIFIWKNITDSDLIWSHIWALLKMLILHPKYWTVFVAAILRLPGILTKRAVIKKEFKMLDKDLLSKFD